jgi:hypothetical protein
MMDNFRARLAIKNCVVQKLITVGSGSGAEIRELFLPLARSRRVAAAAASFDADSSLPPGLQIPGDSEDRGDTVPSVEILSPIILSPRTELSMKHCAIAARDPDVLATFPFLAVADRLLSVSAASSEDQDRTATVVSGSPVRAVEAFDDTGEEAALSPGSPPLAAASSRRGGPSSFLLKGKQTPDDSDLASNKWTLHAGGSVSPGNGLDKETGRISPDTIASPSSPGRFSRLSTADDAAPGSRPGSGVARPDVPVGRLALGGLRSESPAGVQKNKLLWCTSNDPPQSRRLDKSVTGYTFWSPHRLAKLLLMMPTPAACKGETRWAALAALSLLLQQSSLHFGTLCSVLPIQVCF